MKRQMIVWAALSLIPVGSAFAQHDGMEMGGVSAKAAVNEGTGVVKAADPARGVVTLAHEPIASLNWPAMTMDFLVEDKALFNKLQPGKTVRFEFVKQRNQYRVTGVK